MKTSYIIFPFYNMSITDRWRICDSSGTEKRILKTNRHRQRSQPLGCTLWSKEVRNKIPIQQHDMELPEHICNPLIPKVPTPLVSIWCCMGKGPGLYHSSAGRARLLTSFEEVFSIFLFFKDRMVLKPRPCSLPAVWATVACPSYLKAGYIVSIIFIARMSDI